MTNLLVPTEPIPKPRYDAAAIPIVHTATIKDESTTIGIADSDMYDPNLTDEEIIKRFDDMQALGVNTLRVLIPWGAIQQAEPGSPLEVLFPPDWSRIDFILSQAQERDMAVLGVLNSTPYWGGADGTGCLGCPGVAPDPTKFAAFAGEAVTRFTGLYPGVVSAYEVWNEPNYYRSWFPVVDGVAYTEVLKATYSAIKAADPDATVVAGVLAAVVSAGGFTMDPVTFVQTMYANGAKGYFDALSYHPYSYDRPFGEQNPNFISPLRSLLQIRLTMLDNGDDLVKIWASEYGLPTSMVTYRQQADFVEDFLTTWANGLTEEQMAQLPAEFRELAADWSSWIGPAFIYTLRDRLAAPDTEQGSMGLYYFDEASAEWKMKPAAEVIKWIIEERSSPDSLAEALAASLQKLVQQVAESVAAAVQTVVPAVTQTVAQVGAQVADALANALAAWLGSLGKPAATAAAGPSTVDAPVPVADVVEEPAAEVVEPKVPEPEAPEPEITEEAEVTEPIELAEPVAPDVIDEAEDEVSVAGEDTEQDLVDQAALDDEDYEDYEDIDVTADDVTDTSAQHTQGDGETAASDAGAGGESADDAGADAAA
ncbi:cellulase family glycosylhydrolase [Mycolicibacterium pulveris]|uniref:cellulase family glycosylhydrolase n=1 Tax=Mycolicibacterium pulveris TaxID=36813 RepID=UPI0013D833B9|nr:cellulase family glycosylhydrolase [Mycolicibacterium pulveris]MCV6982515.1 cellulase family glycosylhydrolase [Mycolicibacterium pulveris]